MRPIWSLSSRDIPGNALILIVSEPSLKEGRKLRPNVNNTPKEIRNNAPTLIIRPFLKENALSRALA